MRLLAVDMQRSTTVVRHDATLTLLSPTDTMDCEAIAALGKVQHVVVPTCFHDTGMRTAAKAFPEAILWGVSGVEDALPGLPLRRLDGARHPAEWTGHLECFPVEGMPKVNEHVLWHAASGTLVTSDLIFNIRPPVDPWTKLFFKMNGAWERPGPTRIFRSFITDKAAFECSIETLRALPVRRILPAHGSLLESQEQIAATLRHAAGH